VRRVLVVDDDPDIRELLRLVLEWAGYEVVTVNDGMTALETLLQTDETWVVLLDIAMPRMTGLEVCARLSALGGAAARHLIVLMTAGFFPEGDAPPPVRAYLPKPFDFEHLQSLVAELASADPDADDNSGPSAASATYRAVDESELLVA
jgi:CheY-like chemotaxis protein